MDVITCNGKAAELRHATLKIAGRPADNVEDASIERGVMAALLLLADNDVFGRIVDQTLMRGEDICSVEMEALRLSAAQAALKRPTLSAIA
ncbi:hypothetical protein [Burkholderia pseudomallei]|uniref:hypothetical protein n=1 Tax=Burkholderia pseudomallei TaxID=28450 RepID=UPI0022EA5B25|nr:hypothetical protein [Burkholderia pseudomallei]